MIFDSHAHYDSEQFDIDRDELLGSVLPQKGVVAVINMAADYESLKKTVALCEKYDYIYGAVGIHPECANDLPDNWLSDVEALLSHPKIVAVGGGTGLSTMLRGLKKYTDRLTAIVTVADDGGGSGVLRREMGILPPGDVRQCMQALANTEPVMEQLLGYRFPEGQLKGQSFGNLLLAALNGMAGSFEEAVAMMGQVLAISGRVLPVTNADVQLEAVFENGARVVGESHIFNAKKQQDCRIHHVSLVPEHPKALPDALRAISEADLILLGPGSLYTSVIPNLLVDGVADTIRASHAQKFYICNIMTQDGETEGYTAADHLEALQRHGREGIVDLCLANNAPIPRELAARYSEEDAELLRVDRERIAALGIALAEYPLLSAQGGYARHDPALLAQAVMELYRERTVRIYRGTQQYITEEQEWK